ncbi:MAG TPA: hypothetical protein VFJ05_04160 [Nitrososphaeraceae archaeon]|nr:hypothetical protein [Nitrososphaeraceae archaeon]
MLNEFNEIILIGARKGTDIVKSEIGMDIQESPQYADIFTKLNS